MAVEKWCGHDSRGLEVPYDDIPSIQERYERFKAGLSLEYDHLGFTVKQSDIVDKELISISTGDEVGKLAYGTGQIPFIRTSDISNWEIKLDPKQGLSEELYMQYAEKQDV